MIGMNGCLVVMVMVIGTWKCTEYCTKWDERALFFCFLLHLVPRSPICFSFEFGFKASWNSIFGDDGSSVNY